MRRVAWILVVLLSALPARAQTVDPADPLGSVMWTTVRDVVFPGATMVFDDHVQVFSPPVVEDTMNVPVSVLVNGLPDVEEIVLLVDHNPIFKALAFFPVQAAPAFETVIKVQEATPIRAAARTSDGVWHVGGLRVDAAGGGCTVASVAASGGDWDRLNEVSGTAWRRPDGGQRLRFQVVHPMDTGLVDGIPPFFIERLSVATPEGQELARLELFEPVSENPVFTIDLRGHAGPVVIGGADTDANQIAARIGVASTLFGLLEASR